MIKRLLDILFRWDGLWSVPLVLIGFLSFEFLFRHMFGAGVSSYDPGILQSLVLASVVSVAFNFLSWLGIRFNFPDLYKYYQTKINTDLDKLQPWQRISIVLGLYAFYFCTFLFVLVLVL